MMPLGQVPAEQTAPSSALAPALGQAVALSTAWVVDSGGEAAGHARMVRGLRGDLVIPLLPNPPTVFYRQTFLMRAFRQTHLSEGLAK